MRRYPQVGFSAARRSASRRISAEVDGRPGGRCGWAQCPTMRRRCQRNSVSGVTGHPVRLGRASAAAIAPSKLRSASVSSGRSTWRGSTASWWRNTMISRSFERPDRTVSRASDARNRYKIRYTRTASARIAAGQRPRPSFRHPQGAVTRSRPSRGSVRPRLANASSRNICSSIVEPRSRHPDSTVSQRIRTRKQWHLEAPTSNVLHIIAAVGIVSRGSLVVMQVAAANGEPREWKEDR